MPRAEPMHHAPELRGLVLPPPLPPGRPSDDQVRPWLDIVEHLLARGVDSPGRIGRLLGVDPRTASRWLDKVHARWSTRLTDERLSWRREALWQEADAVTREAWRDLAAADNTRDRTALYKILLMANQRKAAITGIDKLEVKVDAQIKRVNVDVVAHVGQELGLTPAALRELGRHASRALSKPSAEGETLDAEVMEGV